MQSALFKYKVIETKKKMKVHISERSQGYMVGAKEKSLYKSFDSNSDEGVGSQDEIQV
jgi:hypothetical protein